MTARSKKNILLYTKIKTFSLIDGFIFGFSFLSVSMSIGSLFGVFVSNGFISFFVSPVSSGCPFLITLRTSIGLAPTNYYGNTDNNK